MNRPIKRFICCLLALAAYASTFAQNFTVENYEVDVYLRQEGFFEVVEKYDVNFDYRKHGIYRDIVTSYDLLTEKGVQEKRKILISDIEVPGHKYEASGKFAQKMAGYAHIKIGDPDRTVIGPVSYEIRYRVDNALLYEEDYTRFYWNLKPTQWIAPFKSMTFRVHLPDGMGIDMQEVRLYTGPTGFTDESEEFELDFNNGVITGTSVEGFVSNYGQAVTILVNLPPDSIAVVEPAWPLFERFGWIAVLLVPIMIFYRLFKKFGKDDPAPAVITYFPPDDIDPAMAGFLINDREDTSDMISFIPHWGRLGLIEVQEIDKKGWLSKDDTLIKKLNELPADAPDYERTMFDGLFSSGSEVLVSSLKDKFYTTMSRAKSKLKKAAQKYYDPKARAVFHWSILGIILVHLALIPLMLYFWGILAGVITFVSMVVLLILNMNMIKKNKQGTRLFGELKGFRQFIKTAEANKLKMLIQEQPNYFEATMSYALTFGIFKEWTRKFEGLNVPPPNWYHSTHGHFHSMDNFSNSFSNSMKSTSSTMVSSPSSSGSGGGGSSGGGFGGGGGGSW